MISTNAIFLADSQGKYFDQYLEENGILTVFNSGDRIKDLQKYMDIVHSFRIVIVQIGSNDTPISSASTILKEMQGLYQDICRNCPGVQVFTFLNYLLFACFFMDPDKTFFLGQFLHEELKNQLVFELK